MLRDLMTEEKKRKDAERESLISAKIAQRRKAMISTRRDLGSRRPPMITNGEQTYAAEGYQRI